MITTKIAGQKIEKFTLVTTEADYVDETTGTIEVVVPASGTTITTSYIPNNPIKILDPDFMRHVERKHDGFIQVRFKGFVTASLLPQFLQKVFNLINKG